MMGVAQGGDNDGLISVAVEEISFVCLFEPDTLAMTLWCHINCLLFLRLTKCSQQKYTPLSVCEFENMCCPFAVVFVGNYLGSTGTGPETIITHSNKVFRILIARSSSVG